MIFGLISWNPQPGNWAGFFCFKHLFLKKINIKLTPGSSVPTKTKPKVLRAPEEMVTSLSPCRPLPSLYCKYLSPPVHLHPRISHPQHLWLHTRDHQVIKTFDSLRRCWSLCLGQATTLSFSSLSAVLSSVVIPATNPALLPRTDTRFSLSFSKGNTRGRGAGANLSWGQCVLSRVSLQNTSSVVFWRCVYFCV